MATSSPNVQKLLLNVSDYFDINDVLQGETLVPITYNVDCSGPVLPSAKPNRTESVPMWLAEVYSLNRESVSLLEPNEYSRNFLTAAASSPIDVNFKFLPHYYFVGHRFALIFQNRYILDELLRIAVDRFRALIPEFLRDPDSPNASSDNPMLLRLCDFELDLLRMSRLEYKMLRDWKRKFLFNTWCF
ncbi:hypothetical protein GEMRC1_009227 [Eukaryota sp. GEM-RC1]